MRFTTAAAGSLLGVFGCVFPSSVEGVAPRPPDVPGTWETAAELTLGACGAVRDGEGSVTVVLNLDGFCVSYDARVDVCHAYDDMEVAIGGVPIKRVHAGGFSTEGWCRYPKFDLDCDETRRDRCWSTALFDAEGTFDLTVRIGGDARTFRAARWLTERTMRLPGDRLVPGRTMRIEVGARAGGGASEGGGRETVAFDYDDSRLNRAWCAILHNEKPWTTSRYDETGDCSNACCSVSTVAAVEPSSWRGEGFDFAVPARLPPGAGRLVFGESGVGVTVSGCPFARCRVTIARQASLRAVVTPDGDDAHGR